VRFVNIDGIVDHHCLAFFSLYIQLAFNGFQTMWFQHFAISMEDKCVL